MTAAMNSKMTFGIYFAVILIFLSFLFRQIIEIVPEPFMDEIFHVRQTHEYFKGNWNKWDPMITTPPGLYIVSVLLLKAFKCEFDVKFLRLLNVFVGVGIFLLVKAISGYRRATFSNERALLVVLLPNLFIFFGLYYTDAGSVLLCLAAYYAVITKRTRLFLLAAIASLLFRQTNIIWVALFSVADQICKEVDGSITKLWKKRSLYKLDSVLSIFLIGIFAIGVVLNGGSIALGDKHSHTASLHLAQFFYCNTTIALFFWPLLFIRRPETSRALPFLLVCILAFIAVRFGTIAHPYLLADNRHWTNFIWRRALKHKIFRYLLVPVHALAILSISDCLIHRGIVWLLGYFVTCAIVLIPSPLIEPRYYILPMIFFVLNCQISSKKRIALQIGVLITINSFIVGWFLNRPFVWPHFPDTLQRRIW